MTSRADIDTIKEALVLRLPDLLRWLGVRIENDTPKLFLCLSPLRPEENASFAIYKQSGGWCDYGNRNGGKNIGSGDIIGLISAIKGDGDNKKGLQEALKFLGLKTITPVTLRNIGLSPEERERRDEARREKELDDIKRATHWWHRLSPTLRGTVADDYLKWRGIDLDKIPHLEHSMRFDPGVEHWMSRTYRKLSNGRSVLDRPGGRWPAIVSQMREGGGRMIAVHVTFLRSDGKGKAPVKQAKLMWPAVSGSAIRLTKGASGLGYAEAVAAGVLDDYGFGEGVETSLTFAQAAPDMRIWAPGSLPQFLNCPIPANAKSFLLMQDNDWHSPEARAGFGKAMKRFEQTGKPTASVRSPSGSDFNSLVNEGERR